jgi:hypothetical protein
MEHLLWAYQCNYYEIKVRFCARILDLLKSIDRTCTSGQDGNKAKDRGSNKFHSRGLVQVLFHKKRMLN